VLENIYNENNTLILLEGLYKSLIRNKIDLTENIDYKALDKVLSIKDQATLLCLNSDIKLYTYQIGSFYDSFINIKDKNDFNKIEQSVVPISKMEETKVNIYNLLYDDSLGYENLPYKILTYRTKVVIVLSNGAFKHLDDGKNLLKFLLTYFKELEKITSLENIAKHPLFKLFIDKL